MSIDDIYAAPRETASVSHGSDSKLNLEQDRKQLELAHLEKAAVNKDTQFIDENLVRAENEDKVTPYLVFLIAIVSY
jgi:SP family myo-inositol transporter-like MFS transporter 13